MHRTSPSTDASNFEPMEEEDEDDDVPTDYLSLPVGSFAEDSPPRRRTPEKEKQSPYYPHPAYGGYPYYTKSPRAGGASYGAMYSSYPPLPKGGHYPYMPYRYYPPPGAYAHQHDPWTSPQAYDAAFGGAGAVKDDCNNDIDDNSHGSCDNNNNDDKQQPSNLKDAFRTSPSNDSSSSTRRPSPPPPPMDGPAGSTHTTPEKVVKAMRSPFRSPPLSQTKVSYIVHASLLFCSRSANTYLYLDSQRSPFNGSPTPLGGYGSFGMLDTPGGTLAAEFSPMGPVMNNAFTAGFGEHPTPPQLSLSRSNSEEDIMATDKDAGSYSKTATSPFSGFIKGFSGSHLPPKPATAGGGLHGVSRSPLMSERRLAQSAS
jgi:hypothetical protein